MIYMLKFPVFGVSDYVSTKKCTYVPVRISSIAIAASFRESYKYQVDNISVGIHRITGTHPKLFNNAWMSHKVFINLKIIMVVHNIGLYQKSNWTEKMVKFSSSHTYKHTKPSSLIKRLPTSVISCHRLKSKCLLLLCSQLSMVYKPELHWCHKIVSTNWDGFYVFPRRMKEKVLNEFWAIFEISDHDVKGNSM